jgi:alkyl hydroperoxide reductase subunit AhpF
MVLDKEIKTQLAQYLNLLESDIVLQTDFMNDLNKNMTYFQMPVKFSKSEGISRRDCRYV